MPFIFLSAILFGLVHPGSKFFLSHGLDLLPFCELYILFRLLMQIPVILLRGNFELPTRRQLLLLISVGVLGAALQLSEFSGIAIGVPVAVVTFLVYTHPVWTLMLSRFINHEELNVESMIRLAIGIVGIALISGSQLAQRSYPLVALLPAITAGFIIALWVTLSNKAKKEGLSTWSISFYYDLIAFVALAIFATARGQHFSRDFGWLIDRQHIFEMIVYAFFIGLLPNLLFYHGSLKATARSAGLALLVEPVVASLTAAWIWHDHLSNGFVCGAILILMTGVPMAFLKKVRPSFLLVTALLLTASAAHAGDPPATHGMLVFGDQEVYFSHLPMFHRPHDYQVIMKVELPKEARETYLADAKTHPEVIYTFVPQLMVLPEVASEKKTFSGDLYRGHFEQGGKIIVKQIEIKITDVITFRKFDPAADRPPRLQYLVFGQAGRQWAAHVITRAPDFDHVLQVKIATPLPSGQVVEFTDADPEKPLRNGETANGQITGGAISVSLGQTKYLDYDDLN